MQFNVFDGNINRFSPFTTFASSQTPISTISYTTRTHSKFPNIIRIAGNAIAGGNILNKSKHFVQMYLKVEISLGDS
jgi:hypothetical protein